MSTKKKNEKNKSVGVKILHDLVLIRPLIEKQESESGIILPNQETPRPERGEVVAVGDGKVGSNGIKMPMTVQVGDTVLFKTYSTEVVVVGGEEFLAVRETDINAIIE